MRLIIFLALALFFPLLILWSLSDPPQRVSIEMEMALVNAGEPVRAHDDTVEAFGGLLDRLEQKSSNSRREIADLLMAGYLWRKERGNLDSLLEFTRSVEADLPDLQGEAVDLRAHIREMLQM